MTRSVIIFLVLGVTIIFTCCTKDPTSPPVTQVPTDSTINQIEKGNFDFEGRTRNYKVFLPENYSNVTNLPLMVYLHAYDWTPEQEMINTQMNLVADTAEFIVVYPYAISLHWSNGGEDPDWPNPDIDDVGFINALIDTLNNSFSIDLERIYVCGFSAGGFMTYRLACQLSHRFAAVASVAGLINNSVVDNCYPDHTIPVLHVHGTSDDIVPFIGGAYNLSVDQVIHYFAGLNGCVQVDTVQLPDIDQTDECTVEKISYTNCNGESNIIFFKVINGGHSWPSATKDYSWAGNRNLDINASVEIWNFFKNYKLNQ